MPDAAPSWLRHRPGRRTRRASWMEEFDMREAAEWRRHPSHDEPRLDERQIERLAVERDDRAGGVGRLGHGVEQRMLGGKARKKKLADPKPRALEPSAADEE